MKIFLFTFFLTLALAFAFQKSLFHLGRLETAALENDETVEEIYKGARALLTDPERVFLEEILAADDLILERQMRSIIDQFLSTLSGTNPALSLILNAGNTTLSGASNSSDSAVNGTKSVNNRIQDAIKDHDNHLFSQIAKVIGNTAVLNVTGVIDNSLRIATPAPVRELVNRIVEASYCNGVRRLVGRC